MVVLPLSSQPVAVGDGTWHRDPAPCGHPAAASALSFHLMKIILRSANAMSYLGAAHFYN